MNIIFEQNKYKVYTVDNEIYITDGEDIDSKQDTEENRNYYINLVNELIKQDKEQEKYNRINSLEIIRLGNTNATRCGISDFYEDVENQLKKLLINRKDFIVEGSSKEEICSFRIEAIDDEIKIIVYQYMNEGIELIYDVLEDNQKLTEYQEQEILNYMNEDIEFCTETEAFKIISRNSTIEDIQNSLDEAMEETNSKLKENFNNIKGMAKYYFNTK